MSDLSGPELSVALAEALGWTLNCCDSHARSEPWVKPRAMRPGDSRCKPIPAWHASMDALLRDVLPVLEAKGWRFGINACNGCHGDSSDTWEHPCSVGHRIVTVEWFEYSDDFKEIEETSTGPSLAEIAEAFARACYGALKEATHES